MKKILIIIFVILLVLFLIEAIAYLEVERLKKKIYVLRDQIISLKMDNREMRLEYREIMDPEKLNKWAENNGFVIKWKKSKGKNEK
ncbi:MAG: hypothetical protein FXF47_07820 [Candidatus Mcinerneyibacterium aminivorans]|jgi:cell division protein FtsL|uniref:Cell division protein FtsL n=1 Tax=Candidatus Mcinerneyibacterium aminivorans TaxID=2703815 RepID=A0A5D0MCG4_9BACT|nr:MAG: hypothetical protein FXF47_07820 [Candidatus Mcinerneyibacterium aminivorans]